MKIVLSPVGAPTQKLNFFLPHKNKERLCFVVYLNFNYERNFRMTEKLKVSREVANALDSLNRKDLSIDTWIRMHSAGEWKSAKNKPLNTLSVEEFATALIVGYEVEMTPHELIQKAYKKSNVKRGASVGLNDMILAGAENGFMNGVEFTLNTLGITVKGVNDNETI